MLWCRTTSEPQRCISSPAHVVVQPVAYERYGMRQRHIVLGISLLSMAACGQPSTAPSVTVRAPQSQPSPTQPRHLTPTITPHTFADMAMGTPLPTGTPSATTFRGRPLPPPPNPPSVFTMYPPAAWLIQHDIPIHGTVWNFCYTYRTTLAPACADWAGRLPPLLAPTALGSTQTVQVVVGHGAGPTTDIRAQLRPAHDDPYASPGRPLEVRRHDAPDATIATIELVETNDVVLDVTVTFGDHGTASYLWYLTTNRRQP